MSNENDKSWYQRSGLLIGLAAAAVGGGLYYLFNRSKNNDYQQEDLKELSIRLAKDAFKHYEKKRFREAASLFTEAICLDGTNYRFFTNRALVHSKLNMHNKVVADCTKSIELQETSKAYFLRGRSRVELHNYDAALRDLRKCEKWNDKSTRSQVQNLIRRCMKKLGQKEELMEQQKAVAGMNQYEEMKRSLKNEISAEAIQLNPETNQETTNQAVTDETEHNQETTNDEIVTDETEHNQETTNDEIVNDDNQIENKVIDHKPQSNDSTTENEIPSTESSPQENKAEESNINESIVSVQNSNDQEPVNSLLLSQDNTDSESSSKLFSSAVNVKPSDSMLAQKD